MYKQKFEYVALSRETIDGSRKYCTPDGNKIPSVTTILDKTKPKEKIDALMEWRRAVGEEKAQQITTEAANRGTKMHSYLEHFVLDGKLKDLPSNIFHHSSWHMAKQVIEEGLSNCQEFWGVEIPLYHPNLYAGTTDCVGIHKGNPAIIDFKQSNKVKKREWIEDYFLQLCAYAEAHNEIHGTDIRKGVIMMSVKPNLDANGILTSSPTYLEFILEGTEFEMYRQLWWQRVEQYYNKFG